MISTHFKLSRVSNTYQFSFQYNDMIHTMVKRLKRSKSTRHHVETEKDTQDLPYKNNWYIPQMKNNMNRLQMSHPIDVYLVKETEFGAAQLVIMNRIVKKFHCIITRIEKSLENH